MWERKRETLSAASGVLALGALLFLLAGLLWGLIYPRYRGTLLEGGAMTVDAGQGEEFRAWLCLVLGAGLLAGALAVGAFLLSERSRGLLMQVWLGAIAGGGTACAYATGLWLARRRVPVPDPEALRPGEAVEILGAVGLGAPISILFPALMAVLAYWSCMVVGAGEAGRAERTASGPSGADGGPAPEAQVIWDAPGYYNRGTEKRP